MRRTSPRRRLRRAMAYRGAERPALRKPPALVMGPLPQHLVRCECGVVISRRKDGNPRAHNYCLFAPANVVTS